MRAVISLAIIIVMLTTLAVAAPQNQPPAAALKTVQPAVSPQPEAMVTLDSQPLFPIRVRVLSFSPEDRARLISARLAKLVRNPLFNIDSLKVADGESTSDIVSGDTILMSVTEAEALAEGKTRLALAEELAGKIRAAVVARNKEYSTQSLLSDALYTVLVTLVLIGALLLINHFHPKIRAKVHSWRGTYIRSIRFQSFELLHEERISLLINAILNVTRTALVLGLFFLYIPLVLSFFPWTHGVAAKLLAYTLAPLDTIWQTFVASLPKLFFLLVIIVITRYTIKFMGFLFSEVEKQTITIPGFYPDWSEPTFKIVRFLMLAFAAVVAFPYLPGSDSPAFKGVSIFLGVLFSLGSSSALSNIVAGVVLTYTRAFKVGDRIKISDAVGDVIENNLLITRIRTIKNVDVTVPNAMVLASHITNYSSSAEEHGLILHTTVTIGYDAPWRQVHELLIAAARATENILELPAPFVLQTSLDDFYVSYQINAFTDKPAVMARTYSVLHQNIQEKFNEAGVEIMSPHYSALRDGSMITTPEPYLPESNKRRATS
ncbi:MAG TPA: mechanosensitive ion channel family protein [Desulfuromonadales bacterium]|nr:mechanosensitive ion channel family protein [Desulfuromonadales bacterium]